VGGTELTGHAGKVAVVTGAGRMPIIGRPIAVALAKAGCNIVLAGKHPNKVKVACAREMVGFVWESLNQAAAA